MFILVLLKNRKVTTKGRKKMEKKRERDSRKKIINRKLREKR